MSQLMKAIKLPSFQPGGQSIVFFIRNLIRSILNFFKSLFGLTGNPLTERPKVTRVKVAVVSGGGPPTKDTSHINFEGVSDVTSAEWNAFTQIHLKFGDQGVESDWYAIFDATVNGNNGITGPTFDSGPNHFGAIEYVAEGIQAKLKNAHDNGITGVPLRLYNSNLDYNRPGHDGYDPNKPNNPYIFGTGFSYGGPVNLHSNG